MPCCCATLSGPPPASEARGRADGPQVGSTAHGLDLGHAGEGSDLLLRVLPAQERTEQATLVRTLRELEPLAPSFVSVTYRGGRESRQRTHDLVAGILRTTVASPPWPTSSASGTPAWRCAEILVALPPGRGGEPHGPGRRPAGRRRRRGRVSCATPRAGGAGPRGRRLLRRRGRPSRRATRRRRTSPPTGDMLAAKLAMADFAVTQFFFEADEYLRLVDDLAERGVTKPVLPGIMPVTSLVGPAHGADGRRRPGLGRWSASRRPRPRGRRGRAAGRDRSWPPTCAPPAGRRRPGPALLHAEPLDARRARSTPPCGLTGMAGTG